MTPTKSQRGFLANSAILSLTMLAVSGGNYFLNVAMARLLAPAEFGDANLAINLVLAAAAVAATLQLATSKSVAAHAEAREQIRTLLARRAGAVGVALAVAMAGAAPWLQDVFQTSTRWMFVIIGLGLPVYFLQAVHRGVLQGDLRISRLALSYGIEAAVRVTGALALLLMGFGVVGAAVGISLSFVASAAVARARRSTTGTGYSGPAPPVAGVVKTAFVLLAGQVIISNGDVVLSKALFDPQTAGVYAAAALIGRAVFFLSWSVVHVAFPMAARADGSLDERKRALRSALILVGLLGAGGVVGVWILGDWMAPMLFGDGYEAAVSLLVPYTFATAMFAVANLVASVDLAVGRSGGPIALLAGSVLQTLLLATLGTTPTAMVTAQVVAMTTTVVLVGASWLIAEHRGVVQARPSRGADEAKPA